ncbi:ATP-binding protein [Paraburkholderia solisilvae]|nr:ATP-binding protein [Paraburkholderia solisilvae]
MRERSWAIAMTVAIVITVGGLVLLESARQRIAAEYETALDARGAAAQLSELGGQFAQLNAHQSAYLLARQDASARAFCGSAARIRHSAQALSGWFSRAGEGADSTERASFAQVVALLEARIDAGAAALQRAAPRPLDLAACEASAPAAPPNNEQAAPAGRAVQSDLPARPTQPAANADLTNTDAAGNATAVVGSMLALLRDNEERRAQHALDASRADQRLSTLYAAGLSALNIVLFILLFRNLGIQIDSQARVQRQLITQQEELDQLVNERTRQLEALGWHLQAVSENEKTQLARELHDELGAILTASKMDVAWANRKLKDADPAIVEKLQRALANLDQGIALKRRIIEDMRPTVLANFGLVTALRTLADEAAQRNSWTLELHLPDDELALNEQTEIALFRVAQESLNNAAKYARASQVTIGLAMGDGEVTLHIADNGIGIMPADLTRTHTHGLLGMRQRVAAHGGRFEIRRGARHGTDIQVVMPAPVTSAGHDEPDARASDSAGSPGSPGLSGSPGSPGKLAAQLAGNPGAHSTNTSASASATVTPAVSAPAVDNTADHPAPPDLPAGNASRA